MHDLSSGLIPFLRSTAQRADGGSRRSVLATLRRGLGKRPGEAPELFPYIVPTLPSNASAWTEECHYLVAALFAHHPKDWTGDGPGWIDRNLGASARLLYASEPSDGTERRFVALLNARSDDVAPHLRGVIRLLGAHDVPVDWEQLLRDLQRWEHEGRRVQRAWARAFWGQGDAPVGPAPAAEATAMDERRRTPAFGPRDQFAAAV